MRCVTPLLVAVAYLFLALSMRAQDFPAIVHFPDANHLERINVKYQAAFELGASNACANKGACADRFWAERRAAPPKKIAATQVEVKQADFSILAITLEEPVPDPKGWVVVASNLVELDAAGNNKEVGWKEFPVAPQLVQNAGDEQRRTSVRYASLFPHQLQATPDLLAELSKKVTVTDPNAFDKPFIVFVSDVRTVDQAGLVHEIELSGLPRGKKLNAALGGIDVFLTQPVAAKATMDTAKVPKGRDDANLYLNVAAETNDISEEQKFKVDTRLTYAWRPGNWEIGPTLDAVLGNKTSKAPNTAALSADFRYWWGGLATSFFRSQALLLAPTFRTDRDRDNRDLGIDIAWEPRINPLERTLEVRRARAKVPPHALKWGYRIRPVIATELGRHLKSIAPEVEDTEFSRLRGSLVVLVERENIRLTVTAHTRHLFTDEVLVKDGAPFTVDASDRGHVRIDLSYDIGNAAWTITHMDGRLPPAFSQVNSTSLGITFKF